MPRGKYVNHKGRSRKFTAPEELQQESSEEENSSDEEVEGAAGTSSASRVKKPHKKAADESSTEEESDESEDDRGANKGVAGLIDIENPNRQVKKTTTKVKELTLEDEKVGSSKPKTELSRREREQIEKQKQRQRYEKLHAEGKTTEAKSDLARLAIIRQQRAEAAAKREAERKALEVKKPGSKE